MILARQAVQAGVRRFVFISSIKVHGDATPNDQPFTAFDPVQPKDPYGISKREAEVGLQQLAHDTGLEVVIIRPPLIYGPGVKANFAALASIVKLGLPLSFGSVKNNRRSLISIDNLMDFISVCFEHPAAINETFLVSDGEDLSTAGLLARIAHAIDRPSRLFPFRFHFYDALLGC